MSQLSGGSWKETAQYVRTLSLKDAARAGNRPSTLIGRLAALRVRYPEEWAGLLADMGLADPEPAKLRAVPPLVSDGVYLPGFDMRGVA